jgi:hypothetical protein
MATQRLGPKKLNRLRRKTGLDIECATVRGNSGHAMILQLTDGTAKVMDKHGVVTEAPFECRNGVPVIRVGRVSAELP